MILSTDLIVKVVNYPAIAWAGSEKLKYWDLGFWKKWGVGVRNGMIRIVNWNFVLR